jgi:Cu/Ag efflux protein CusF
MSSVIFRWSTLDPKTMRIVGLMVFLVVLNLGCRNQSKSSVSAQASPTPPNLKPIEVPSPIVGKPYPGVGVVLLINKKEGWIEIEHEEIEGLMPAMVMEWHVKEPSLLNRVKVGDKVNFTVVETGHGEIITDLSKYNEQK